MITKLQVIVREVYEQEELVEKILHNRTGKEISEYDYKHDISEEERKDYTIGQFPSGKLRITISEDDPVYGQIFSKEDLNIKDLILHLNRTK